MGLGIRVWRRFRLRPLSGLGSGTTVLAAAIAPIITAILGARIGAIPGVKITSHLISDGPSAIAKDRPDVLVCDPTLGTRFSSEYLAELRSILPQPRLMVLTNHDDPRSVASALALGVQSFVLKSEPIETIRTAVELVCRGGVAFSIPVAALLASKLTAPRTLPSLPATLARHLTPRELQVLDLVGRGGTDAQIGDSLRVSTRTVERHISNVLNKLSCRNRSEAIAKVLGAVPPLARVS